MKKIILTLTLTAIALNAYAQNINSTNSQFTEVTIEDIVRKLNNLKTQYESMSCNYEVFKLSTQFKDLAQDIDISGDNLMHFLIHGLYNEDMYYACLAEYNSYQTKYESLRKLIEPIKVFVKANSLITELEKNVLIESINIIETHQTNVVDACLHKYKITLDEYKKHI